MDGDLPGPAMSPISSPTRTAWLALGSTTTVASASAGAQARIPG
jgi:hypothetical protein